MLISPSNTIFLIRTKHPKLLFKTAPKNNYNPSRLIFLLCYLAGSELFPEGPVQTMPDSFLKAFKVLADYINAQRGHSKMA